MCNRLMSQLNFVGQKPPALRNFRMNSQRAHKSDRQVEPAPGISPQRLQL